MRVGGCRQGRRWNKGGAAIRPVGAWSIQGDRQAGVGRARDGLGQRGPHIQLQLLPGTLDRGHVARAKGVVDGLARQRDGLGRAELVVDLAGQLLDGDGLVRADVVGPAVLTAQQQLQQPHGQVGPIEVAAQRRAVALHPYALAGQTIADEVADREVPVQIQACAHKGKAARHRDAQAMGHTKVQAPQLGRGLGFAVRVGLLQAALQGRGFGRVAGSAGGRAVDRARADKQGSLDALGQGLLQGVAGAQQHIVHDGQRSGMGLGVGVCGGMDQQIGRAFVREVTCVTGDEVDPGLACEEGRHGLEAHRVARQQPHAKAVASLLQQVEQAEQPIAKKAGAARDEQGFALQGRGVQVRQQLGQPPLDRGQTGGGIRLAHGAVGGRSQRPRS